MRTSSDLVGRRFERLIVTRRDTGRYWLVRCDCGKEKRVRGNHLTCGLTLSCGCLAAENARRKAAAANTTSATARRAVASARVASGMKHCTRRNCAEANPQPVANFMANRTKSLDGLASWCRSCRQDHHLKHTVGVSLQEKRSMIAEQGGTCANRGCGVTLVMDGARRNAHVDHDHATGAVRGILCRDCNLAMGYMQDSPLMIAGLLGYAKKHARSG